jgi:predicted DNA-binding antitoxin AbrB/MazE fold protein
MPTVHAIFENGVFRPLGEVKLPQPCEVEFEPRVVAPDAARKAALAGVYAVLGKRYESGETDTAARHDEHQP